MDNPVPDNSKLKNLEEGTAMTIIILRKNI